VTLSNLTGADRMADAGEPMKTVKIELPDEAADALARAAAAGGFASPSELARVVIEDFLIAPVGYDRDALARDIAQHQAEKQRGEVGFTPEEARARLRNASSA
jgi:Arc/MetJ-type ribon-helix-helix transcriptional regulator